MMTRNLRTKKNREYWKFVAKVAKEVAKWPKWKKGWFPFDLSQKKEEINA